VNTAGPRLPLIDPIEPPERAPESLSEGGFPAPAALEPLRAFQSLEVLDLLKIDQCTTAEVLDLLDPDRNAAELDSLLEALHLGGG
jgi:hypothetical protein